MTCTLDTACLPYLGDRRHESILSQGPDSARSENFIQRQHIVYTQLLQLLYNMYTHVCL